MKESRVAEWEEVLECIHSSLSRLRNSDATGCKQFHSPHVRGQNNKKIFQWS